MTELASVIWAVQMSTVEFHPWNSRRADVESPDEWRIDIDPMPECSFDSVRRVAGVAHEVLDEIGAVGWPKTSGGAGIHIYVRIEPGGGSLTCGGPLWPSPARSSGALPRTPPSASLGSGTCMRGSTSSPSRSSRCSTGRPGASGTG